jgi:hypothetical protein
MFVQFFICKQSKVHSIYIFIKYSEDEDYASIETLVKLC